MKHTIKLAALLSSLSVSSAFAYTNIGPTSITKDGTVLDGVHIENTSGDCLDISAKNVIIRNSDIGPCSGGNGRGIHVTGQNTKIENTTIHDIQQQAISIEVTKNVSVQHNFIQNSSTAVYVAASSQIDISYNLIDKIRGDTDAGHAVIFNQVNGPDGKINCNKITNKTPYDTEIKVSDIINTFSSSGTSTDPIQVNGNRIIGGGGGDFWNGGGILLGDGAGVTMWQEAKDNLVYYPGGYGIEVMTGGHINVLNNFVYSSPLKNNQHGLYAAAYYYNDCMNNPSVVDKETCYCKNIDFSGNRVVWANQNWQMSNGEGDGNCSYPDGTPITTSSLAARNDFADNWIVGSAGLPDGDKVRPSCDSDAGIRTVTTPPSVPPVSTPPEEQVPPVSVPPISVPPVSVPPESVPPVSVPPESVPPISVPPVSVPSEPSAQDQFRVSVASLLTEFTQNLKALVDAFVNRQT